MILNDLRPYDTCLTMVCNVSPHVSVSYFPLLDDVLKARLKTIGVCEYIFQMEAAAGAESGTEWRIIDVGGSRSQRRKAPGMHICVHG